MEEVRLERDTLRGQAEKLGTILKGKDTELGKRKEVMDFDFFSMLLYCNSDVL